MFETLVCILPPAVLIAGLFRPRGGVLLLALCLPLFGAPPGGPYLGALDAAALAAIATSWRAGPHQTTGIDRLAFLLVLVSAASLVPFAYHPPSFSPSALLHLALSLPEAPPWSVLYTLRALLSLGLGFLLYLAIRRAFGASVEALGVAVGTGLGLVLLLGLLEHGGLISLDGYRATGGPLYETRLHSLFFHSGWLSQYVVLAAPFAVLSLASGGPYARAFAAGLVVASPVTLLFTQQRGAWIAALAQGVALLLCAGRSRMIQVATRAHVRRGLLFLAGTMACGAAVILLNPETLDPTLARLSSSVSDLSGRTHLWRASAELFLERPVLGWGLGAFAPAYDLLHPRGSTLAWGYRDDAHNVYINVAVERGALGLAALLTCGGALALGLWRASRTDVSRNRALGPLLSLVGFAVVGLVQDPFYLKNIQWLSWILFAAAAPFGAAARFGRRPGAALLTLTLVVAGWRALAVAPLSGSGNLSVGLHEIEKSEGRTFRWTTGYGALRLPWKDKHLVLPLANGHPHPMAHPVQVRIRVDGREVFQGVLRGGWEEILLELGKPRDSSLFLELQARPTFRPFTDAAPSIDFRELGIALGEIRWEPEKD